MEERQKRNSQKMKETGVKREKTGENYMDMQDIQDG